MNIVNLQSKVHRRQSTKKLCATASNIAPCPYTRIHAALLEMTHFSHRMHSPAAAFVLSALSCTLLSCQSATLPSRVPPNPLPSVKERADLEVRLFCPEGHSGNCNTCPTERLPGLGKTTSGDCSNVTSVAGLVQVKIREANDAWVFVSAEGWSAEDMEVVCHQLGYPDQFGCPDTADLLGCDPASNNTCGGSAFQRDISFVTMINLECAGREINFGRCPHLGWDPTPNPPRQVAAVACGYSGTHRCPTGANARVRLRTGAVPSTGRLEVFHDGEWGTVCGSQLDFTLSDANVACLSMGFGSAKYVASKGGIARGFDRVWLNKVGCSGDESSLEECSHPGFGVLDDYWCERHYSDMGLVCNSPQDGLDCEPLMRLHADTNNPNEPQSLAYSDKYLEVNVNGEWGLVCYDPLTRSDLTVLCQDLEGNFGLHSRANTAKYYKGKKKYLGHLNCTGSESTVEDCPMAYTEVEGCPNKETVVDCTHFLPDLLPDMETFRKSIYGWVEVESTYNLQCEIEEGCLATNVDSDYRHLLRFSTLSSNFGLADFLPHEPPPWDFHVCHNHFHSHETFASYELLLPDGSMAAKGHKASFCLEDSLCINTHRKYAGCLNLRQGISKDCSDLYTSRLACQWIDITGVKQGEYVIQVTISPGQEVQELDYENNQISCNITLDVLYGYYLPTIHGCARRGYSSLKSQVQG